MRALVVHNPNSGRGRGRAIADRARAALDASGFDVVVEATVAGTDVAPAAAVTRRFGGDVDRVVVVGGDGTLREAIEGLGSFASKTPVAFLALGNANVIANEFDLPAATASLDWLASERTTPLDVARAGDRLFLAVLSVGFDTFVTRCVGAARRSRIGGWFYRVPYGADTLYVLAGLIGLARVHPTRFALSVDGEAWPLAYPSIWVCNTKTFAKGCAMTPAADATDGVLDVHACRSAGPIAPFRFMAAARAKRAAPASISTYGRGRKFVITAPAPFYWQIDGDAQVPTDRLEIDVLAGFARIVLP